MVSKTGFCFHDFVVLIRFRQWYKNSVIFLPLVFAQQLFNVPMFLRTLLGFLSMCLVSSAAYIINDIADAKKDAKNHEKKHRPLASRRVSVGFAASLSFILLLCALALAWSLTLPFFVFVFSLFMLTQLYTFLLRSVPLVDVLLIAVNFVLRSVSGAFVASDGFFPWITVSPWLILCPFFLSLFLSVGKRESELRYLGGAAKKHRYVLEFYSKDMTRNMMTISTTLLILSYSLYSFLSKNPLLLITLPAAIYVVFRYLYLIETGSPVAREPGAFFKDRSILVGLSVWVLLAFSVLYIV